MANSRPMGIYGAGFYCSSSIENWREKIGRRFEIKQWSRFNPFKPAVFFGLYNTVDYLKFLLMPRVLAVFWAGGDIKQLKKRKFWRMILPFNKTKHVCENAVEQKMLKEIDISAIVQPCLVDDLNEFGISFKPSKAPDVYLTINDGREKEYGIEFIEETLAPAVPDVTFHVFGVNVEYASRDNVVYHRRVPEEVFNEKIKQYQGALRLNVFDGFAEPLAKSAIMGQYPISAIAYPHITHTPTLRTLIKALNELKNKKEPNYEAVAYWRRELSKSLEEIIQ